MEKHTTTGLIARLLGVVVALWGVLILLLCLCIKYLIGIDVWGSGKSGFGDWFSSLSSLFAGVGAVLVFFTIKKQMEMIRIQQQQLQENSDMDSFNKSNLSKTYIFSIIDKIVTARSEINCPSNIDGVERPEIKVFKGESVAQHLLCLTRNIVREFYFYVNESNPADCLCADFDSYLDKMKKYLGVHSLVYFVLMEIKNLNHMDASSKMAMVSYMIFSLTPYDKQLLNIIFMRFEFSENLDCFEYVFNDQLAKNVIYDLFVDDMENYNPVKLDEAICYFLASLKANTACRCAERIVVKGVKKTRIVTTL